MQRKFKLPIGIENFEEIRTQEFYYVDKTNMIRDLLYNWGKVNLFTRPRRFGKSINMSMLKSFLEIGCDASLFEGLKISEEAELCREYMGKFPVISISLKSVSGVDYESARQMMCTIIRKEALRFSFLLESDRIEEIEKKEYRAILRVDDEGFSVMPDAVLTNALLTLSQLLHKHYAHQVIILIDEYDVPLDRAYQCGYYDKMVELIRNMFLQALKTNDSLFFAVMTGCLRISKESIFTGLNNPKVLTVTDVRFDEYFGFTNSEVRALLSYYELDDYYDTVKEWYDGYRFGDTSIYCPWDVINYCDALCTDRTAQPENYWSNTSSNNIVKRLLGKANALTKKEMEALIAGESVKKTIRQELTYKELDSNVENIWSILFMTGYLTSKDKVNGSTFEIIIPNREIRNVFVEQITEWFREETTRDGLKLSAFCRAFREMNPVAIEEQFGAYLLKTISIRDTNVQKEKKENFYHGILLGLLSHMEDWGISSNAESGEGYSDILVEIEDARIGIIIEVKYAENGKLEEGCRKALKQIEDNRYEETLLEDGMQTVIKYGIACYKKRCKVVMGE